MIVGKQKVMTLLQTVGQRGFVLWLSPHPKGVKKAFEEHRHK